MMYGADAGIENMYKQMPVYLTSSDKCIAQFEDLVGDGELCRADLRDRLEDDREEVLRLAEERAGAEEQRCALISDMLLCFVLAGQETVAQPGALVSTRNCCLNLQTYSLIRSKVCSAWQVHKRRNTVALCLDLCSRYKEECMPKAARDKERKWCRQEQRRQDINATLERREREDREEDAIAARDTQRRKEEEERLAKDADEKMRTQEEFQAWLQAEVKRNKQAKASK